METLKQHLVQKPAGILGFVALLILAVLSWSFSAAVWPGLLILLLALVYGLSVATGGAFFENLLDSGQRLMPIASSVSRDFSTAGTDSASTPQPIRPAADSFTPTPSPFPASTPATAGAPTPASRAPRPPADQERAADPTTSQQTLMDLAAARPELRPTIALNPNAYPDLLTWLGAIGDPAIDEALRRRGTF
nr:hypothetical protein [Rhodococcus sp. (in: high G+C Gram-positive bacteria)]